MTGLTGRRSAGVYAMIAQVQDRNGVLAAVVVRLVANILFKISLVSGAVRNTD